MRNDVVDSAFRIHAATNPHIAVNSCRDVSRITILAENEDRTLRAYLGGADVALKFVPHERAAMVDVVGDSPDAVVLQLDCPEHIWLSELLQLRRSLGQVPIVARFIGAAFDSLVLLASFGVRGHMYDVSSRWRHVQAVRIVSIGGVAWSMCDLRKALFVLETDTFLPTLRRIQRLAKMSPGTSDAVSAAGVAAIARQLLQVAVTPVQRGIVLDWKIHAQNLFTDPPEHLLRKE